MCFVHWMSVAFCCEPFCNMEYLQWVGSVHKCFLAVFVTFLPNLSHNLKICLQNRLGFWYILCTLCLQGRFRYLLSKPEGTNQTYYRAYELHITPLCQITTDRTHYITQYACLQFMFYPAMNYYISNRSQKDEKHLT